MNFLSLLALCLLMVFAGLILFFADRARKDDVPRLRPISAFETLQTLLAQSVEAGRRLHLSLGTGGIANATTAETLAGLTALDYLAHQTVAAGAAPLVTTSDPVVMLMAQGQLRQAYQPSYVGQTYTATEVRWLSTQPAAYAAGVMDVLASEDLGGNVLLGHFGDEYLLVSEPAYRLNPPQETVAAAADPNVLPYVYTSASKGLWGEEMFAVGAYLAKKPFHIGSLLAQDTVRWLVGVVILVGVVLRAFGVVG